MTFIYPLMLAGMVAVGLPILLHLLMRQKPKHQMFPAFRFLQQRAKRNQRKIRLRHLLLLLMRMLLLALICLALAGTRGCPLAGGKFAPNQAVAAGAGVDTSKRLDKPASRKTRLRGAQ